MLEFFDVDGMSDEEDETQYIEGQAVPVFIMKSCPWHASKITGYLKIIDQEYANPVLEISRHKSSTPHICSDKPGGQVKIGLPHTMYNPVWMAEMSQGWEDFESENIRPSKETYELLVLTTHT